MSERNISSEPIDGSMERPRPDTWAASPIDLYGSDKIKQQQLSVGMLLVERAEEAAKTLGLSEELAEAISVSTIQRFHHESKINHCNYSDRLYDKPVSMSLEFLGSYERSMSGVASPHDLIQVRKSLGMPSIELAKLSHVGGIGIENLSTMRQAVYGAVISLDGYMYRDEDVETSFNLISNDSIMFGAERKLNAITMTRKRLLGEMSDGTSIREKSQFVLVIDEDSAFDQNVAKKIRSFAIKDGETWRNHIMNIPGFQDAVDAALESDRYEVAIPLVTTIYAYNKETEEQAAEKKALEKAKSKEFAGAKAVSSVVFIRDTDGEVRPDYTITN